MLKYNFILEEIGTIFTENAACILHFNDRGKVEINRRADLVITDKQLKLLKTIIKGEIVFSS